MSKLEKRRARDSNQGPVCPKSGDDGNLHHGNTSVAAIGQQYNDSECHSISIADSRLQKLVETWGKLREEVKCAIEALCF